MPRKKQPANSKARVTSILSCVGFRDGLMYWYGKHGTEECNRVKRESAAFGTAVHSKVEEYFRTGQHPEGEDRAASCARLIVRWIQDTRFVPLQDEDGFFVEREVESEEDGFVGHPDAIGYFMDNPDKLGVVDWKTSGHIDDNYPLQLAAYAKAIKEQYGHDISFGVIVRVEKDPTKTPQFEIEEYVPLEPYYPLFKCAKTLYDFYKRKAA